MKAFESILSKPNAVLPDGTELYTRDQLLEAIKIAQDPKHPLLDKNGNITVFQQDENSHKLATEIINTLISESGKEFMIAFYAFQLKTHISGSYVNEVDGAEFTLEFKKVQNDTKQ